MAADDGHARAGAADLHLGQVEDLAALVLHLHLLAGVALEGLAADLGDDVVRDLILEDLGLKVFALGKGLDLIVEFVDAALARAADGLVGRGDDRLDGALLGEGVNGHEGHDGGAVGVRDDALVPLHVLGVDLGDDKGDVGVEAERARIVDEHRARLDDRGGKTLGDVVLGRAENDIKALKRVVRRLDDGALLTAEHDFAARASGACDGTKGRNGEVALFENFDHFLTDGAGGAENTDIDLFHTTFSFTKLLYRTRMACSKSFSSTPTMMLSSSGPCVIMRMFTPFSPSLAKILPETPGRYAILRPTAATMAICSVTVILFGCTSFCSSPSIS